MVNTAVWGALLRLYCTELLFYILRGKKGTDPEIAEIGPDRSHRDEEESRRNWKSMSRLTRVCVTCDDDLSLLSLCDPTVIIEPPSSSSSSLVEADGHADAAAVASNRRQAEGY